MRLALLPILVSTALPAAADLVTDVRALNGKQQFAAAEQLVADARAKQGGTVEVAEATSWLGRGALAAKQYDRAAKFAGEAHKLAVDLLKTRKLDDEKHLPLALGASIEVTAQAMAARGSRSEAVAYLNSELAKYRETSIHERVRKNINLLSLEGKAAPPLVADKWLAGTPQTLASLKGKAVLLFLWAHWCADCKGMAPTIASLRSRYGSRGLVVLGPTKLYGYAAEGMDAPPAQELTYINQVRQNYYADLAAMPVPVGNQIFRTYGVSTTPTLVLIDRSGVVRLYHPGAMPEAELSQRIEPLLAH